MRLGCFEIKNLDRPPNDPIVIAALWPWIDVNRAGTLVLKTIKKRYSAKEIGRLFTPGIFYDFTRYRPQIEIEEEIKGFSVPNSTIYLARRENGGDIILLRMLEPHCHAELFVRSIVKVLKEFKVKTYILVGSMHDAVPHTRPLIISGYGMGENAKKEVKKYGVLPIVYKGPSTMMNMVTRSAYELGIETMVLIVSIPHYVVLDEDHEAKLRLIELLARMVDIPLDEDDYIKVFEQKRLISENMEKLPEIKAVLPELERMYDMRVRIAEKEGTSELSPDIEELLWKTMGKDVGKA